MKREVGGPRDGKFGIDWTLADDPSHRGTGTASRLYTEWQSSKRWMAALGGGGQRVFALPGRNMHFVLIIGNNEEAKRARFVDYMTQTMGGRPPVCRRGTPWRDSHCPPP